MEFMERFNDAEAQSSFTQEEIKKNQVFGLLGFIFPFLFFLPVVCDKQSNYCKFCSNQQLTWFLCDIVIQIILVIVRLVPVLGTIASALVSLCLVAAGIILGICAYQGKAIRIPFVGNLFNVF